MARIKNGITGGFSGKVGAIIGYQLRGKDYLRSKANPTTKLPTQKQLANRERFRLMQAWRSRFTVFFAITFKNHTHERSAQNAAHAFNAGIIVGEYPAYYIDASKVIISKGQLPGLAGLNMQVDGEKQLHFSWNNSYGNSALPTDVLSILIWYDEGDIYEASTTVAQRADESLSYTLKYPVGQTFANVYVTVLSDDRERAANSCYMGRVEL